MKKALEEQYLKLGISEAVLSFGNKILASLEGRFRQIDEIAEYFTELSAKDIQEIEKGLLQTI